MLRFIWVIVSCLFLIMYYVPKMSYYARHPENMVRIYVIRWHRLCVIM